MDKKDYSTRSALRDGIQDHRNAGFTIEEIQEGNEVGVIAKREKYSRKLVLEKGNGEHEEETDR